MLKYLITFILILSLQTITFAQTNVQSNVKYRAGQLLVQLETGLKIDDWLAKHENLSLLKPVSKRMSIYLLEFDAEGFDELSLLKATRAMDGIEAAQFNHQVTYRNTTPNDPNFAEQEVHYAQVNAPALWDLTTGGLTPLGDTIVVAVIDNGLDINHEDIRPNLWRNLAEIDDDGIDNDGNGYVDDVYGYNFDNLNDVHSSSNHGTSVCGIVGAKGNNGTGVTGINWDVKIMFLSGAGFEAEIVEAYSYILEQRELYHNSNGASGAFVVSTNASFGIAYALPEVYPLWCNVYNTLGEAGILNIGATVNESSDVGEVGDMPTTCTSDYLLTVTNVDEDDKLYNAGFGSEHIDIAAPGEDSYSTKTFDNYNGFGGTSGAAPHVTGAVGLLYSMDCAELTNLAKTDPPAAALLMKDFIINGARSIPELADKTVSGGILDLVGTAEQMKEFCNKSDVDELVIYNLSPNPASEMLILEYNKPANQDYLIRIFNPLGQEMGRIQETGINFGRIYQEIPVAHLGAGIYYLTLSLDKEIITRSFLIER